MSSLNGRSSALVESIVSGEGRQGVGGLAANDPQGLCVATMGSIMSTSSDNNNNGVYTNLVRLAAQLPGADGKTPLITIETADKAIVVKDYAGYAVAVQIPKKSSSGGADNVAEEESKG